MIVSILSKTKRGFSLIEAAVVISIIGILFALLCSAVLWARNAANNAYCRNNLRQIGIALNIYAASNNQQFPCGNNGRGYSVLAMLLPHIDQFAVYNSINFNASRYYEGFHAPNHTALSVRINLFICPADELPDGMVSPWTNYAGNHGVGYSRHGHNNNGVFDSSQCIGPANIPDGASTTVAIAEWNIGGGGNDPKSSVYRTPHPLIEAGQFETFVSQCRNLFIESAILSDASKGTNWADGNLGKTLYNHNISIDGHSCTNHGMVQQGSWTAGSRHSNSANVLFADGHVAPIGKSIDISTWRAIGTRNGAEVIDN